MTIKIHMLIKYIAISTCPPSVVDIAVGVHHIQNISEARKHIHVEYTSK